MFTRSTLWQEDNSGKDAFPHKMLMTGSGSMSRECMAALSNGLYALATLPPNHADSMD